MDFESELISGSFVKRYKRFFTDVRINNKIVVCHCPNTGSMMGLLDKGNRVWISKNNNPERKLKFTLQIIEQRGNKVGVNTHITNKIFYEALKNNKVNFLRGKKEIIREFKYNKHTRFDFLVKFRNSDYLIEVKNVTLSRKKNLAEFPDSVTSRGAKHIKELTEAAKKGYKVCLVFIAQREDCKKISIAKDLDPYYSKLLTYSLKKKLKSYLL